MSNSKREDKLEALDFVLSVLEKDVKDLGRIVKDLEKVSESFDKLDELASRLGAVETLLATYASKIPPSAPSPTAAPAAPARTSGPPYTVTFRIWEEFKAAAEDAELITFGIAKEDTLEISAQKEGRLCRYQGKLPRGGRIIKSWLARELGIQEARIVEGELSHSK